MYYLRPHCNSFPLEDYIWWGSGVKKHTTGWCATCGEKYDWKQPNRLLVVQTGDSIDQAKVFKAHAVPQGLCANWINVLKLLANQQEDGDGLLQNIVKDLGKESREGLTNGLREFIKVDVGSLIRGTRTFQVRKPKVPEGCLEVIVRESLDELTLRAEEVGTSKALINVDHVEQERWCPHLVDADWCALCQALYEGIEGEGWEGMRESYKEMSRAVGAKKPQEAQKADALWKMTIAKDAREEYYDPMREDKIKGRVKTRLSLWEEHLKDPIVALDKAIKCVNTTSAQKCWT